MYHVSCIMYHVSRSWEQDTTVLEHPTRRHTTLLKGIDQQKIPLLIQNYRLANGIRIGGRTIAFGKDTVAVLPELIGKILRFRPKGQDRWLVIADANDLDGERFEFGVEVAVPATLYRSRCPFGIGKKPDDRRLTEEVLRAARLAVLVQGGKVGQGNGIFGRLSCKRRWLIAVRPDRVRVLRSDRACRGAGEKEA